MVYVAPIPPHPRGESGIETVIRPGQHIGVEGQIYHPYLARWGEASSTIELIGILRDVFSKEPPVVARPISHQSPIQPPPIPPIPPESSAQRGQQQAPQPPPQLPKSSSAGPALLKAQPRDLRDGPPQLPPVPADSRQQQFPSVLRSMSQLPQMLPPPVQHGQPPQQLVKEPHLPPLTSQQPSFQQPAPIQRPVSTHLSTVSPGVPVPVPVCTVLKTAISPVDQFTDPFDTDPLSSRETVNIAPPPLPPNPQKSALLNTLSEALAQHLQANISEKASGLGLLSSQADAMRIADIALQDEVARATELRDVINGNVDILKEGLAKADEVIRNAKGYPPTNAPPSVASAATAVSRPGLRTGSSSVSLPELATGSPVLGSRPLPSVDETLVPPTVVHKQLHDLVIQERAIQRALYALREALTKGRAGIDVWAKVTRSLAREAFLKKALAVKAAEGASLDLK
ncbi:hypothetical protein KEM55_001117 [Ascosphaera atra]|nr:hypothetical protein KEM55_001117 [Ascosphaera atra]